MQAKELGSKQPLHVHLGLLAGTALVAMAMVMVRSPVHRPDVDHRWRRYIHRRRRRVIDGRRRGDIHCLRGECATYDSTDTKPGKPSANIRTTSICRSCE